jgi:hypothetical protein
MQKILVGASIGYVGGLSVVAGTAYAIDQSVAAPKYTPKGSRYDNSQFKGRFASMLSTMNPTTLFASDAKVVLADQLLKDFEQFPEKCKVSNLELWNARLLRE